MPALIAASSSSYSAAAMPWPAGPITSAGTMVPVTSPAAGQVWVPAGPLPRFVHRNTLIPPAWPTAPKWMWACETMPTVSAYVSRYSIPASVTIARNVPWPAVDRANGASS